MEKAWTKQFAETLHCSSLKIAPDSDFKFVSLSEYQLYMILYENL